MRKINYPLERDDKQTDLLQSSNAQGEETTGVLSGEDDLMKFLYPLGQLDGFLSAHRPDEIISFSKLNPQILNLLKKSNFIQEYDTYIQAGPLAVAVQTLLKLVTEMLRSDKEKPINFEDVFDRLLYEVGSAKRPRREKVVKVIEATKARIGTALEQSGKTLQGANELRTYSSRLYKEMRKTVVELVERSFITGELSSLALYTRPELWINFMTKKEYAPTSKGLELLRCYLDEIIALAAKRNQHVTIFDLGIGTGEKAEVIINECLKKGKTVEYHAVDSSDKMLETATIKITKNILSKILALKENDDIPKDLEPWRPLIEFIREHALKETDHTLLQEQLQRIFYKFANPEFHSRYLPKTPKPQLLKHLLARLLSLHVRKPMDNKKRNLIKQVDEQIQLPINLIARCQLIERLTCDDYRVNENEAIIAFDLGCRACNMSPSESIKDHTKFLSTAKVAPEFDYLYKDEEDEAHVKAPYLVAGMQISRFDIDEKSPKYKKEKDKILEGYLTPEAEALILHPYTELSYTEGQGGELMTFYQLRDKKTSDGKPYCEFITDYEPDPQKPSERRVVHKLRFNKTITAIGQDAITIPKNREILLMTSYKPTLEQIIELYTRNQIHICKIYKDDADCPEYIKILLRRMTPAEEKAPPEKRIEYLKRKFIKQGFSFLDITTEA